MRLKFCSYSLRRLLLSGGTKSVAARNLKSRVRLKTGCDLLTECCPAYLEGREFNLRDLAKPALIHSRLTVRSSSPPKQLLAVIKAGCLRASPSPSQVAQSMGWSTLAHRHGLTRRTIVRIAELTSTLRFLWRGLGRTRMATTCHIGRAIRAFLPFAGPPISIGWLVVAKMDQSTPATCSCSSMV